MLGVKAISENTLLIIGWHPDTCAINCRYVFRRLWSLGQNKNNVYWTVISVVKLGSVFEGWELFAFGSWGNSELKFCVETADYSNIGQSYIIIF